MSWRRWAAKTVKRPPQQPAQPQCSNYWALLMRKRHHKEHRLHWQSESIDPTQHAKERTGDCPGARKETAPRQNVTQGGPLCLLAPRGAARAGDQKNKCSMKPGHGMIAMWVQVLYRCLTCFGTHGGMCPVCSQGSIRMAVHHWSPPPPPLPDQSDHSGQNEIHNRENLVIFGTNFFWDSDPVLILPCLQPLLCLPPTHPNTHSDGPCLPNTVRLGGGCAANATAASAQARPTTGYRNQRGSIFRRTSVFRRGSIFQRRSSHGSAGPTPHKMQVLGCRYPTFRVPADLMPPLSCIRTSTADGPYPPPPMSNECLVQRTLRSDRNHLEEGCQIKHRRGRHIPPLCWGHLRRIPQGMVLDV